MARLIDKIPKDFDSLSREEQERILVEDIGMPPSMARFRVAMLRGESDGDATITTTYVRKDEKDAAEEDTSEKDATETGKQQTGEDR